MRLNGKVKIKAKKLLSLMLLLVIMLGTLPTNIVFADQGTIQYDGKISKGQSTVGVFHVDGKIAFCMDHEKTTPANGTAIAEKSVYSDPNVIKCLYYGWEGPGQWSGFGSDRAYGIVATTLAIDHFVNGGTRTVAQNFINFINSASVPREDLNFSTTNFTMSVQGDKQVSNSASINGNEGITLKFSIPDDVTIICENRSWNRTGGTVEVSNGDIIHFEAPLTKTGNWTSSQIANSYEWNAILSRTYDDNLQRIVRLGEKDPGTYTNFSINFISLGGLELYKTDSKTGQAIANTEFRITGPNGYNTTKTTDGQGYFKIDNLSPGVYQISESKSAQFYKANSKSNSVTVVAGQTATVRVQNDRETTNLRIKKVDSRDNTTPIANVTFELYSSEDNYRSVLSTKTTTSTGTVEFTDLRIGYTYKVKETSTDQYYTIDQAEKEVFISDTKEYNMTITNSPKGAYLQIEKADVDYKDMKLSGFTFSIYEDTNNNGELDSSDKLIQTLTTKENGKTDKSQKLPIDKVYFAKETTARDDYRTSGEVKKVTFTVADENKTLTYNFYNKKKDGGIKIHKVDSRDNTTPIEGAEFELFSKEFNRVIQTETTDQNGEIVFSNLRVGEYLVREVRNK